MRRTAAIAGCALLAALPAPALEPLPGSENPPRAMGQAPITWVFESPVADRITMTLTPGFSSPPG